MASRNTVLTGLLLALGVAVPVVLAVEAAHQATCDRECLIAATGGYLDAMLQHNPAALKVAADVRVTENGKAVPLGEGLWKNAKAIPSRQAFADPSTGEAGFFGVVTEENGQRAQLAVHLKIQGQRIEEIETLVSPEVR